MEKIVLMICKVPSGVKISIGKEHSSETFHVNSIYNFQRDNPHPLATWQSPLRHFIVSKVESRLFEWYVKSQVVLKFQMANNIHQKLSMSILFIIFRETTLILWPLDNLLLDILLFPKLKSTMKDCRFHWFQMDMLIWFSTAG